MASADGLSGIQFTLTNFLQYISFIAPFLLIFFFITLSVFNQDLKGFIYLAGILIASVINLLLLNIIRSTPAPLSDPNDPNKPNNIPLICKITNFNVFTNSGAYYDSPNMSSMLIGFTIAYLCLPMVFFKQLNFFILIFLVAIFVMDAIVKMNNFCLTFGGAFLGLLVGLILGGLWYFLFQMSGKENSNLLYFSEPSTKEGTFCSKPSKQSFKCEVYKNGQLISSKIK